MGYYRLEEYGKRSAFIKSVYKYLHQCRHIFPGWTVFSLPKSQSRPDRIMTHLGSAHTMELERLKKRLPEPVEGKRGAGGLLL